MKISKTLRKYLSLFLCLCVSTLSLPVYASSTDLEKVDYVKVELTDEAMSIAVGASGSVDVTMSDHTKIGAPVQAVLANRSGMYQSYTMEVTDSNGVVLETLVTGSLSSGEAVLITGTPTATSNGGYQYVRTTMFNGGVPVLGATDASAAQ